MAASIWAVAEDGAAKVAISTVFSDDFADWDKMSIFEELKPNTDSMKRISAIALVSAAMMLVASVESIAQIGLGVGAGYLNSGRLVSDGNLTKGHGFNGLYAGVDYTLKIVSDLYFVPGVSFQYTTGKATLAHDSNRLSSKVEEMYVSVPLDLEYKVPVVGTFKIFVMGGPVVSYGVKSTESLDGVIDGVNLGGVTSCYKNGIFVSDISSSRLDYSPLDLCVEAGGGIEVGKLRLSASYGYGLLNRYKGDSTTITIKRNQVKMGVSFIF